MLRHYLVAAARSFGRGPWVTAVNVLTLALGLVSFVVAFAVADYWSSADRHLADAERTLAVTTRFRARDGAFDSGVRPLSSQSMAQYLEADFPQLAAVARAKARGHRERALGVREVPVRGAPVVGYRERQHERHEA